MEMAWEERLQLGLEILPWAGLKNWILQTEKCPRDSKEAIENKGRALMASRY